MEEDFREEAVRLCNGSYIFNFMATEGVRYFQIITLLFLKQVKYEVKIFLPLCIQGSFTERENMKLLVFRSKMFNCPGDLDLS